MELTRSTSVNWVTTTASEAWHPMTGASIEPMRGMPSVFVEPGTVHQGVEGFGASFSECGWKALGALDETQRDEVLRLLFAPGEGAGFTQCRMPVGANDFSLDWYSYDEVDGDFDLEHFSIANDLETLVPFIRAAKVHQPDLRMWASPWSPPSWLKHNGHYAGALASPGMTGIANGLRPDQVGAEGTDMFIQDEKHLATYAAYFGRFVDAYRAESISIDMVMPQNEFNSPQSFPSCTWTPESLARFVRHLGPEMSDRGVEVFLGTLERGNEDLLEATLRDPVAGEFVVGAGFQWAGKYAVAGFHSRYPALRIYQTEQECGTGGNDWRFSRYAWSQIRRYFESGANAYTYWNMVLDQRAISSWGWPQNSLVTVDTDAGTYRLNPDYYVMRHVSQYVRPGARRVECVSLIGYDNLLVFRNEDDSLVIVIQNDLPEADTVTLAIGGQVLRAELPADSLNTLVVPAPTP